MSTRPRRRDVELSVRPRHVRIPEASAYGGDSRSVLYKKAAITPGLFVKNGSRTLVDLDVYDRLISARPLAVIKRAAS